MSMREIYDRFTPLPDERLVQILLEAAVTHRSALPAAISSVKYERDDDGFVVCKIELGFRYRYPSNDDYPRNCEQCPFLCGQHRRMCMRTGETICDSKSRGRYCLLPPLEDENG